METGFLKKLSLIRNGFFPVIACAAALLAALSISGPVVNAGNWPMFRGNSARTGYTAEQAAPPLTQAWFFQAGGDILSSPVVFEDIVYFGARDGGVYALNAGSGEQVWRFQANNWVDASPCVSSGMVYAVSADGYLYALNRLTGAPVWTAQLGSRSVSSPLVSGGKVYVGNGLPENKLKAFDALTGSPLGSFPAGQPVDSAPSDCGANICFGANDGSIYAVDAVSLQQVWRYETGGSFQMNAVAVASGTVYALPGHDDKKVYALEVITGTETARSQPMEERESWQTFTSPIISGSRIYFSGSVGATGGDTPEPAGDIYLSALDSQDLTSAWGNSQSLGGVLEMGMLSSPAMANEIIYSGTVDNRLLATKSDGDSLGEFNLGGSVYSSPAVANGRIYVGTMGGKLFAFAASKAASISRPAAYEIVSGTVAVRGYVINPDLSGYGYTLEYSSGGAPAVWHNIESDLDSGAISGGELAAWDTTDLTNGLYTLRLTVLEQSGSPALDNTAFLTVRVNAPPSAPSSLTAADAPDDGGNRVSLNWSTAALSGLTACRVYRKLSGNAGFTLLQSISGGVTTYLDAAAVTGSTYVYTVRAFDGYVESGDSNQVEAYAINNTGDFTPPARVADLAAAPGFVPGMVTLTWTAPGNDGVLGSAAYYVIKRSTDPACGQACFEAVALAGSTRPVDGPAGIQESEEFVGLFGGVTYYFALTSFDSVGNFSPLSNSATAYAALDLVPPLPPSDLVAEDTFADGGGSLTLGWALSPDDGAGADDLYGYKLYKRRYNTLYVSSAPYMVFPKGVSGYTDNDAPKNIRFYYSVAAFDSTNNSALSNEASAVSADNYRFVDASAGGEVRLADGARVEIPGSAASQNDGVILTKLDPATYRPQAKLKAGGRANPTDIIYAVSFKLFGTRLLKPALVQLPYTDASVAGMEEENLRLYTLEGGAWALLDTSSVNAQAKKVGAEVISFSTFTIMEYLPSGDLFSDDEVYTYPNPARGDTLTFKFKLSSKAYVKVDVYNVAGEQVASLEKVNCPAGQTSEIVWGTKGIASGVYVYRVRAESASGNKAIIKKLAIIH